MRRRSPSALSVTRHGFRSPRRRMATGSSGTLDTPAIRMGSYPRKPMVSRRAIRCGVRECRCFSARWRAKKTPQVVLIRTALWNNRGAVFVFWGRANGRLLADDDDLGGRDFEAHEAMVGVEVEDDLEVGSGHFEAFVGLAAGADGADPVNGDGAGCEFLGNEDRVALRAAA